MKNKIEYMSKKEMKSVQEQIYNDSGVYVVELDGKTIRTACDYYSIIEKKFKFPTPCQMNVDSYLDWIRDLSWLEDFEDFCIIIHNSLEFICNDMSSRDMILQDFENIIFPWWENDVEKFCVGGRNKKFKIYMIE